METTLCIDPGIRNLSYCVINSNYEILLWDTCDILEDDNYLCQGLFKNGKTLPTICAVVFISSVKPIIVKV